MLIGELAKASDTTKDTIRHYDELGLLISRHRQAGSRVYKEFSEENLERLEMIRLAKYMGFTLGEIARQIESYYAGSISHEEQIALLQARMHDVQKRMDEMSQVKNYLELKIAKMQNQHSMKNNECLKLHEEVVAEL